MPYEIAGFVFGFGAAFVVTAIIVCIGLIGARKEEIQAKRVPELDPLAKRQAT